MATYESVLTAATQLPEGDRLRLIDALWDTVPDDAQVPLSHEWLAEIDRRVDEMERGDGQTFSWPEVRDAALARLRHGTAT
ncbi:MAG TPA: addiction module protein [Pirellulaceae bacterium]|nr:addiction module protein [Pirellulaceae bacterium]